MCTLTMAWQVFPDTPVVVAANRDEALDRPSRPPTVDRDREPAVVAPRDGRAGGTWIGYNGAGVLVAATNRWTADLAGERSRGRLTDDALSHASAEDAVRAVERDLDDRTYDGFNLVVADATAAFLIEWDGRVRITPWEPGVHVVVNVGADGAYAPVPAGVGPGPEIGRRRAETADRVAAALAPEPGETATGWRDRAAAVLADHEFGVCLHRDGFGTRSCSLLAIGEAGVTYRYADGPPCETPFDDAPGLAVDPGR
ncbi:hypothetical protein BRD17_04710 [Halobacteriales archaeon SW_7_68_16]|nr:MAG: hypothetical protein BRD17_04710 [Halobacteriales archaeon SW_7_68_16]